MKDTIVKTEGISTSRLGSVSTLEDGRKFVHFERHLPHSIEKVWAALTEPDRLADWFPGLKLERRLGGKFEIWFGGRCEGPAHVAGSVTRYEPPNVLEYGSMRYELTAEDNQCKLTFTDILIFEGPRTEIETINSVLGGWHKYLDVLEFTLEGGKENPPGGKEFDYSKVQIEGRER